LFREHLRNAREDWTMHAAKETITKARYFLSRALDAETSSGALADRLPYAANLEAAIVYARASIEHLKADFAPKYNDSGYRTWHDSVWRKFDADDPVFKYFYNRRNFILHQHPEKTTAQVNIETNLSVEISVSLTMVITRGDGSTETRECTSAKPTKPPAAVDTKQSQHFFFEDSDWRSKPAVMYVEEFIMSCERFISEAEDRFL
jgi:hypothetical protein